MSKLGQESIYPSITKEYYGEQARMRLKNPNTGDLMPEETRSIYLDKITPGISKRLYIATFTMQALLNRAGYYWQDSGTPRENLNGLLPEEAAKLAYQYTDELLKQENE